MTFQDRYETLKTAVETFLYDIDKRSVVNFDLLRICLFQADNSYTDPKDGDVVFVEWPDGDRTHFTTIGQEEKQNTLKWYNNKWFLILGMDFKKNDWIYEAVHNVDEYARVLKAN
jgi:hypothetical protein